MTRSVGQLNLWLLHANAYINLKVKRNILLCERVESNYYWRLLLYHCAESSMMHLLLHDVRQWCCLNFMVAACLLLLLLL